MAQASPAKVKVKEINQVALVVKDVQATVENSGAASRLALMGVSI